MASIFFCSNLAGLQLSGTYPFESLGESNLRLLRKISVVTTLEGKQSCAEAPFFRPIRSILKRE